MATETAEKKHVNVPLPEAAEEIGIHYETLRYMAVAGKEFTTVRDGVGKGFRIKLKRDEVEAYIDGGLPALRKFRVRKGRK